MLFHSSIARIYEFHETEKKIYVFMEYCHNGELFNHINSRGPLSEKKAAKIFKQILSAMKYLKSQRIFHRDIKCENILFDKNWNVKLVDFGFATKEDEETFSTTFCGSPSYTAP
jgi:serine/threonine protein kinase